MLTRLNLELTKPVPLAGFMIQAKVQKAGRTMATTTSEVLDPDGRPLGVGRGLHFTERDLATVPTAPPGTPNFDDRVTGEFPVPGSIHGLPYFLDAVEIAYPPQENTDPGPTTLWMKTVPILDGEQPSPFQRLCPLADCGSGVSRNAPISQFTFMNPDLTIHMHRATTSDWIASRAVSTWEPTGVGLAHATLFDPTGPIGTADQTLVLRRT